MKMLIALLLIIVGAWWIFQGKDSTWLSSKLQQFTGIDASKHALTDFLVMLNGGVPLLIVLLGLFMLWLEWDEWKIERELASEERKTRKK